MNQRKVMRYPMTSITFKLSVLCSRKQKNIEYKSEKKLWFNKWTNSIQSELPK